MSDNKCKCGHIKERHMWRIDHKRNDPDPQWCHDCDCTGFTPADDPASDMVEKANETSTECMQPWRISNRPARSG